MRHSQKVEGLVCIFWSEYTEHSLRLQETNNLNQNVIKHRAADTNSFPACFFPSLSWNHPAAGDGAGSGWQDWLTGSEWTPALTFLRTDCLPQVRPDSSVDALHGKHAFNLMGKAKSKSSYSNKTQELWTPGNKQWRGTCESRNTLLSITGEWNRESGVVRAARSSCWEHTFAKPTLAGRRWSSKPSVKE